MLRAELLDSVGGTPVTTCLTCSFLHMGYPAVIASVAANCINSVTHCAGGDLLRLQGDSKTEFSYSGGSHCLFRLLRYDDHWHTVIDSFHSGVHTAVSDEH